MTLDFPHKNETPLNIFVCVKRNINLYVHLDIFTMTLVYSSRFSGLFMLKWASAQLTQFKTKICIICICIAASGWSLDKGTDEHKNQIWAGGNSISL